MQPRKPLCLDAVPPEKEGISEQGLCLDQRRSTAELTLYDVVVIMCPVIIMMILWSVFFLTQFSIEQNQVQNLPCACCAHADSLCQQKLLCQCTFFTPGPKSTGTGTGSQKSPSYSSEQIETLELVVLLSDNLQPSSDFRPLWRHKLASSGLSPRDKQLFQDRPT